MIQCLPRARFLVTQIAADEAQLHRFVATVLHRRAADAGAWPTIPARLPSERNAALVVIDEAAIVGAALLTLWPNNAMLAQLYLAPGLAGQAGESALLAA